MAKPDICQSLCQNPLFISKDKLTEATPKPISTNDNKTSTYTSVVSFAFTLALALPLTLINLMAKYSKKNF